MRFSLLLAVALIVGMLLTGPPPVFAQDAAATCERYAELLSSSFWTQLSRKQAEVFLREHVDPVAQDVNLLLALAGTRIHAAGLAGHALGLLELAKAYNVMGSATAGMILGKIQARPGAEDVPELLRNFGQDVKNDRDLDQSAPRLLAALAAQAEAIDDFEITGDLPGFRGKEVGEWMMGGATGIHKAKGTLMYISLSAQQYVGALHADYLVRKGQARSVTATSFPLQNTPAELSGAVETEGQTYACVEVEAADQWNTISFSVRADGRDVAVANPNLKGKGRGLVAFPIAGRTTVEIRVFNGANCRNTNWFGNRFSARISFLQRGSMGTLSASSVVSEPPAKAHVWVNPRCSLMKLSSDFRCDAYPVWSPNGDRIAFVSHSCTLLDDGRWWRDSGDIYIVDASGNNATGLTNTPVADQFPCWSPDGSKIFFERNQDIYVMNDDGTEQRKLIENGRWPACSPDGRHILFNRGARCQYYCVTTVEGSELRYVNPVLGSSRTYVSMEHLWWATWLPGAAGILFQTSDGWRTKRTLYVQSCDGKNVRQLEVNGPFIRDKFGIGLLVSPDGSLVRIDKNGTVWAMIPGEEQKRGVTLQLPQGCTRYDMRHASMAPDGVRVAFLLRSEKAMLLCVGDLRAGGVTVLARTTDEGDGGPRFSYIPAPQWAPAGDKICFVIYEPVVHDIGIEHRKIYVLDMR